MADLKDVTADLTLDEIYQRLIDNFYLLAHNFRDIIADSSQIAMKICGLGYAGAMKHLGVKAMELYERTMRANPNLVNDPFYQKAYGNRLEREMRAKGVKVEHLESGKGFKMTMAAKRLFEAGNEQEAYKVAEAAKHENEQDYEHVFRTGTYFFKGQWTKKDSPGNSEGEDYFIYDEISHFVGDPVVMDASKLPGMIGGAIVVPGQIKYIIRTNVPQWAFD